jgi:ATP-dependent Lhr-like helicase
VETEAQRELGSLEQNCVDGLVEEMSTFLLAGRAWMVVSLNHTDRLVRVRAAPRGKKPMWGGFLPQFLGREVCEQMKEILVSEEDYPFLDPPAKAALAAWRNDLGALLRRNEPFQFDGSTLTWWTFAGGRINQTLKYAFEWKGRWKVTAENNCLEIKGAGLGHGALSPQLDVFRAPGFWAKPETREKVLSLVPEYRLSKFQRVLPDALQVEMVGDYLVDFDATQTFLATY